MMQPLKVFRPKSLKYLTEHLQTLIKGRLWLKILIAMVLGIGVGILLSESVGLVDQELSDMLGNWMALPGKIFLALIQMIVVPLVFSSVISGLASSEDMGQLQKLGSRLVVYFIFTTVISITIGIVVAMVMQPGQFIDPELVKGTMQAGAGPEGTESVEMVGINQVPEMIAGILPDNPLSSMVQGEMLQVVLFAIVFGLALVSMSSDQSSPLLDLLHSIQDVCMTVVKWAMLLAPIAVFGLLAQITMKVGIDALLGVAVYVATVITGLLILLAFYLVIVFLVDGRTPWWFLEQVREVQLLAFSTSSSAAVMPLSIETAEEKLGVRSSISQFLIPLGATINMDGTALYQGVATVFLAQVFNVNLTLPGLVLVVVTAVGASIGSPATPGVGIVILSMVLKSVGIPPNGIALIIGVDRILDMSRTSVNVTGDLAASIVMNKWVGGSASEKASEGQVQAQT